MPSAVKWSYNRWIVKGCPPQFILNGVGKTEGGALRPCHDDRRATREAERLLSWQTLSQWKATDSVYYSLPPSSAPTPPFPPPPGKDLFSLTYHGSDP